MAVQIYIVDDHLLMRETLSDYIEQVPDIAVSGMAGSGQETLDQLSAQTADLVLIDLSLPDMSGIDLMQAVHAEWPALPCVILSGRGDSKTVTRALTAGAQGYVLKGNPKELVEAIRHVLDGRVYLSRPLRIGRPPEE